MSGTFITFEGIDGSGKSTQLRMLGSKLHAQGFDVLTTKEPGGTPLGKRLRAAFLETKEVVAPLAELLLFAADRAQHVNFLIKPALSKGKIVISDRYADATIAYQGAGRGFSEKTVNRVIELATDNLKPDLTLFFDMPVETALARTHERSKNGEKKNRMDKETEDFYERARQAYLKISLKESSRFFVVDAIGSPEDVHARVMEIVGKLLDLK